MNILTKLLLFLVMLPFFTLANSPPGKSAPRNVYSCILRSGNPTTVVNTAEGTIEIIVWKSATFANSGWTPRKRCNEVTQRFQKHNDNGNLRYIATGKKNGLNIICVAQKTERSGIKCLDDGILITLERNDNPDTVMRELFNIGARRSGGGYSRGGVLDWQKFLQESPTIESSVEIESESAPEFDFDQLFNQEKPTTNNQEDNYFECSPPLCN